MSDVPHGADYGILIEGIARLVQQVEDAGASKHPDPLLAVCLDCEPVLPMPFGGPNQVAAFDDRNDWVTAHVQGTGHRVVRPEFLAHDMDKLREARRGRR